MLLVGCPKPKSATSNFGTLRPTQAGSTFDTSGDLFERSAHLLPLGKGLDGVRGIVKPAACRKTLKPFLPAHSFIPLLVGCCGHAARSFGLMTSSSDCVLVRPAGLGQALSASDIVRLSAPHWVHVPRKGPPFGDVRTIECLSPPLLMLRPRDRRQP
jgi:hypothetical protein